MNSSLGDLYLADALFEFRKSRRQAEKAMAQVSDDGFFAEIDSDCNSIAVIVKHMAGNMRSRWTDFLTADGEKPDRTRDMEFVIGPDDSREALMKSWEAGWALVNEALVPLKGDDLLRTVYIRGEAHSVLQAINRQLTHYSYHTGQIVVLSRHFRVADWKTLSIARGESELFNEKMKQKTGVDRG